jgi:hypothetical protein
MTVFGVSKESDRKSNCNGKSKEDGKSNSSGKDDSNGNRNGGSEIQGFFASLRMTGEERRPVLEGNNARGEWRGRL